MDYCRFSSPPCCPLHLCWQGGLIPPRPQCYLLLYYCKYIPQRMQLSAYLPAPPGSCGLVTCPDWGLGSQNPYLLWSQPQSPPCSALLAQSETGPAEGWRPRVRLPRAGLLPLMVAHHSGPSNLTGRLHLSLSQVRMWGASCGGLRRYGAVHEAA